MIFISMMTADWSDGRSTDNLIIVSGSGGDNPPFFTLSRIIVQSGWYSCIAVFGGIAVLISGNTVPIDIPPSSFYP